MVTPSLLGRTRHRIRQELPGFESTHVGEALARSCGFATNAAMRARIGEVTPGATLLAEVDAVAFEDRLRSLSGQRTSSSAAILERSLVSSSAKVTGPGKARSDQEVRAVLREGAFVATSQALSGSVLTGRQRFAYMYRLLSKSMTEAGSVLDFVTGHAGRSHGEAFHVSLAAAFSRHEDADRSMCSFLVDWLTQADDIPHLASERGNHVVRAVGTPSWGDAVFATFRPRIDAFVDRVCLTWDDAVDPMSLPAPARATGSHVDPRKSRPRFPVARLHAATVRVAGSLGPVDAGRHVADAACLRGIGCFALWRAGASPYHLGVFAGKAWTLRSDVESLCAEWCRFEAAGASPDETSGSPSFPERYFGATSERFDCLFVGDSHAARGLLDYLSHECGGAMGVEVALRADGSQGVRHHYRDGTTGDVSASSPDPAHGDQVWSPLRYALQACLGMDGDFAMVEAVDGEMPRAAMDEVVHVITRLRLLVVVGLSQGGRTRFRKRLDGEFQGRSPYPILDATNLSPVVSKPALRVRYAGG